MTFFSWPVASVQLFLLLLFRCLGIIGAAPALGARQFPVRAKVALGLGLTMLLYPLIQARPDALPEINGWWGLLGLAFHELVLGLFLGFLVHLSFMAIQFSGQLIGMAMGFGIVSVLDPDSGQQISIISQLQYMAALVLFFVLGGHHIVLEALWHSFELLPVGRVSLDALVLDTGIRESARVLTLGFQIAAPILGALFLTEAAMGLIARTVPQMNIFIVGFPVKIAVGLGMLILLLPAMVQVLGQELNRTGELLSGLLRHLGG